MTSPPILNMMMMMMMIGTKTLVTHTGNQPRGGISLRLHDRLDTGGERAYHTESLSSPRESFRQHDTHRPNEQLRLHSHGLKADPTIASKFCELCAQHSSIGWTCGLADVPSKEDERCSFFACAACVENVGGVDVTLPWEMHSENDAGEEPARPRLDSNARLPSCQDNFRDR
jgi:hypothetical protein